MVRLSSQWLFGYWLALAQTILFPCVYFFRVSFKNWFLCADDVNEERCESLRKTIREYFDHQPKLEEGQVTALTFAQEDGNNKETVVVSVLLFS